MFDAVFFLCSNNCSAQILAGGVSCWRMFYFKQTIHVSASAVSQYSANQESGMGGAPAEQSCSPKSACFCFTLLQTFCKLSASRLTDAFPCASSARISVMKLNKILVSMLQVFLLAKFSCVMQRHC